MSAPADEFDLWAHLDRCLGEYRFQVELNWKRTQYFFALNLAILAAGTGLLSSSAESGQGIVITLFVVGVALAAFSIVAGRTQKGYYREARDLVRRVQERIDLGSLAMTTTPGLGSARARRWSVGGLQDAMFGLIGVADLAGLVTAIV